MIRRDGIKNPAGWHMMVETQFNVFEILQIAEEDRHIRLLARSLQKAQECRARNAGCRVS